MAPWKPNAGAELSRDALALLAEQGFPRVFLLKQYAPTAAPVLITGESGTGKELVARAIHFHSGRTGPFVAVNCAGIPDSLFESEFFGHKRGAFTGAVTDRAGLFERATEGMLFLDEIGEMPLGQKAKLLRLLDEDSVTPVGGSRFFQVTARVVAATNKDLSAAPREGDFRVDLLDRLSTLCLYTPSLAEREEDMPELIHHFVALANQQEGAEIAAPTPAQVFSGRAEMAGANIRRLRSAVARLAVVKRKGMLTGQELVQVLRDLPGHVAVTDSAAAVNLGDRVRIELELPRGTAFSKMIHEAEKEVAGAFLAEAGGNVSAARRALGISKDVWYRVRKG